MDKVREKELRGEEEVSRRRKQKKERMQTRCQAHFVDLGEHFQLLLLPPSFCYEIRSPAETVSLATEKKSLRKSASSGFFRTSGHGKRCSVR